MLLSFCNSYLRPLKYQLLIFRTATSIHHHHYSMDKAYLRNTVNSDNLYINFRYSNGLIDRNFNFCRNIHENVDVALLRIVNNVRKELKKHFNKNRKSAAAPPIEDPVDFEVPIAILRNGNLVTNISFSGLLEISAGEGLQFSLLDRTYNIVLNEPWAVKAVLPTLMLAGYVVYPSKLQIEFAELQYSQGVWFKAKTPMIGTNWKKCGDGITYVPSNDDVGFFLKFVFTPGNSDGRLGPALTEIAKTAVQLGPGPCPFEKRHRFTTEYLHGDSFRVISYNILADLYASTEHSRTELFSYCSPDALKMDYRIQLLLKEIAGYNADIICLQEVDLKLFNSDFQPFFANPEYGGYQAQIAQKGTCGEGAATFYRSDRFELLATHVLNIGANITTLPVFAPLCQKLRSQPSLLQRVCDRSTTLQINVLKCKDNGRFLLVANIHLYFRADADHIRLLQIGFAMLYVQFIYERIIITYDLGDEQRLAIVFCGDFNSIPECGIYKLMTEGYVGKEFIDWHRNDEEVVKNVTLTQPFKMQSACGIPLYTNYTPSFAACLDYIFIQCDRLVVEQVIPMPDTSELSANIAIPSKVFPSDHVAVGADLKFLPLQLK